MSVATLLPAQSPHYKEVLLLMGTRFELTVLADSDTLAYEAVQAGITEIRRIEALISSWQPTSQTSAVNRAAGKAPVRVDIELYRLIERAQRVSALTGGAFDLSFAGMERLWQFDGAEAAFPDSAAVAQALRSVAYTDIRLSPADTSVFLARPGMKIGFGAIGKGYAANRAQAVMRARGVRGGVVNAAGDLAVWGESLHPDGWRVQIADPADPSRAMAYLTVKHGAVVTSGDYEKFLLHRGQRYAHIIDPRSGYPTTGIKSVTVVCPDAELADALATAVFVLGETQGLALIDRLKHVECLLITDDDELRTSRRLSLHRY